MAKQAKPFCIISRKDSKSYRFTLNPSCGLPERICAKWFRRSFQHLPPELADQRSPNSKPAAEIAALAFIEYLKRQFTEGKVVAGDSTLSKKKLVPWLLDFWSADSDYVQNKALIQKEPHSAEYRKNNRRDIEKYIASYPEFANLSIGELSKKLIKDWMLWLAKNGLSGDKINKVKQAIRVPVNEAYKNEEIPTYPFLNIGNAYHEPKEKGILTPTEIDMLEAAPVQDPFRRLAILLGAKCGLRRGEIRGLQWGDISDGIIHVRHNYVDGDGLKSPKRKGGTVRQNSRKALLLDAVAGVLEMVREKTKSKKPTDFVMQSLRRRGEVISASYFKHALASELESIGIPGEWKGRKKDMPKNYVNKQKERNLTFHSLRHTFITLGRLAGLTDPEIQALAGHADRGSFFTSGKRPNEMTELYTHAKQVLDFVGIKAKLEAKGERKVG